jgi:hypothetical protein
VNVVLANASVLDALFARLEGALYEVAHQVLKLVLL